MLHCNIVEVQGMFKVEPIGNGDAEIINLLGLSSELETIKSLEVILFNPYCVRVDEKSPLQVLYECGICNIFLPRSEVPTSWCSSNKTMGSSITFNLPSLPNLKIQALKIYVVFGRSIDYDPKKWPEFHYYLTLNNITKGLKWAYSPWIRSIPPDDGIGEFSFSFVKEIGVQIVYDEPEAKGSQHHKAYSCHQNVTDVGDLSAYQLKPGYYHLCHFGDHQYYHHEYGSHQSNHRGENIPLGRSAKIMFGEDDEKG
ncbi:hypothetical protein Vadar_023066 [Vaccinium darrowii]|nr:hypothetical protein Vadar_023066 [Vaccinium darrowii]